MNPHLFIKKISALKEDFYAVGSRLLDAVAHLDVYEGITGGAAFQLRHVVLAHDPSCADVRCPRPGLMIEFHPKPQRGKPRHISPPIQFSAYIIRKKAQIDLVRF